MPAWPRTIIPKRVSPLRMPSALESWSQSGKGQHRGHAMRGRMWQEVYPPFSLATDAGQVLIATINYYRGRGESFTIDHRLHLTHRGGGTGAAVVNGASQTGSTLNTTGWTGSNPVLKHGDIFTIAGIAHAFNVTADAPNLVAGATALAIDPPILAGGSPANSAAITYTGALLTAFLVGSSELPDATEDVFLANLTLTYREAV